jgi:hypothetical protein
MRNYSALLLAFASLTLNSAAALPAAKIISQPDRIRVELGGQLFSEYIFSGAPRPYFYPVLAADGMPLNRDFPMKKDTPGEETDHPHHRSLWFTHGAVNGVDFWTEGAGQGTIVSESVVASAVGPERDRSNSAQTSPASAAHSLARTTRRPE